MWFAIKRLVFGVVLIVATSSVLLWADRQVDQPSNSATQRVAILQYSSRPILDEGVDGIIVALAEHGYVEGDNLAIKIFNAENDMPTANNMAKAIVGGGYDLAISVSTPCLQAMAGANQKGQVKHVFGIVTDPFTAGVGINRDSPQQHPPHMTGIGSFQPVVESFDLALELNPRMKRVGVVWNPSEPCSEACTLLARKYCSGHGLELLEAHVENSVGVEQAASSLVARGVDVIWIGGDNTVEIAASSVIRAARSGHIPVFANAPNHVESGALFGLGADYKEVGVLVGELAARILGGLQPSEVPVENKVPPKLAVNLQTADNLPQWRIPDHVLAQTAYYIDRSGQVVQGSALKPPTGSVDPLASDRQIKPATPTGTSD